MKNYAKYFGILLMLTGLFSFTPQPQKNSGFNIYESGSTVSKAQLMVYSHVYAGYGPDFAFDIKLDVKSYDIIIIHKHGDAYFENVNGNKLTSTIYAHFTNIKPGDMIILSNVKVKGPSGIMTVQGPSLRVI
jgi:hypothetical protein